MDDRATPTGGMPIRRLMLLRHALAEPGGNGADFDRPLSIVGRRQSTVVGERLLEYDAIPQVVLCSAATRTRQTWQLAAAALGERAEAIEVRYLEELYGADEDEVVEVLRALAPEVTGVLVVGHEPVMSAVARLLAGPRSQEEALVRVRTGISTATVAFLETARAWSALTARSAVLRGLVTAPKD